MQTVAILAVVVIVGAALGLRIDHYARSIMALNTAQTTALLDAVGALGVDLDELADRLAGSDVVDDPNVAGAIAALRGHSTRIDSMNTAATDDGNTAPVLPEPVDPGS